MHRRIKLPIIWSHFFFFRANRPNICSRIVHRPTHMPTFPNIIYICQQCIQILSPFKSSGHCLLFRILSSFQGLLWSLHPQMMSWTWDCNKKINALVKGKYVLRAFPQSFFQLCLILYKYCLVVKKSSLVKGKYIWLSPVWWGKQLISCEKGPGPILCSLNRAQLGGSSSFYSS